jgi:hypothetical protein
MFRHPVPEVARFIEPAEITRMSLSARNQVLGLQSLAPLHSQPFSIDARACSIVASDSWLTWRCSLRREVTLLRRNDERRSSADK